MTDKKNTNEPTDTENALTRRGLIGAGLGTLALAGMTGRAQADDGKDKDAEAPFAFIDGTGPGWVTLTEKDFVNVNSAENTWSWKDGVLYCTGKPISVLRTAKPYTNFELIVEWNHRQRGGNSGVFVWADGKVLEKMTALGKPGLPNGIEVQILDTAFAEVMKEKNPKFNTNWFTSHGDVFAVRAKMTPFPPLSPNRSRSFPSEDRVKPSGQWNHYYVRAINGEIRLWVNGKEVSGGNNCDPKTGFLCLESEGAPIEFRKLCIRELP